MHSNKQYFLLKSTGRCAYNLPKHKHTDDKLKYQYVLLKNLKLGHI